VTGWRARLVGEDRPWGVLAVVGCGVAAVAAGLDTYWFTLVNAFPPAASYARPIGTKFSVYGEAGGIELWVAGFLAVAAVSRRSRGRRFGRSLVALAALGLLAVLVRQRRALPEMRPHQSVAFLIADLVLVGCLAAYTLYRYRYWRPASAALVLTGVATAGATLVRMRDLTGLNGFHDPYSAVSHGPFVLLGGATLLAVGGALLSRTPVGSRPDSARIDERSAAGTEWRRRIPTSVGVLAACGVVGVALGVWEEWAVAVVERYPGTGDPVPPTVGSLPLDLVVLAGAVAAIVPGLRLAARTDRPAPGSRLLMTAGATATAVPVVWRTALPGRGLPWPGYYLTLCAGAALLVAGALWYERARVWGPEGVNDPTPPTGDRRFAALPWGTAVVALAGGALVAVGTRFAWGVSIPDPAAETPPETVGLAVGLAGSNAALLALVAVGTVAGLAVAALWDEERGGAVLLGTGLLATAQVTWRIIASTGADGLIDWPLLVGPGAYLALGGATTLLFAGAVLHGTAGTGYADRATRDAADTEESARSPVSESD